MITFSFRTSYRSLDAKQKVRGFTLVETLVALSIFSVSLVALLNATSSGASDVNFAKNKVTASFLAQEGVELVRNIRDTSANGTGQSSWDVTRTNCLNARGCYLAPGNTSSLLCPLGSGGESGCPVLRLNTSTGYYTYLPVSSTNVLTDFRRVISFENTGPGEIRIVVEVLWNRERNRVTVSETLFDWRTAPAENAGGPQL